MIEKRKEAKKKAPEDVDFDCCLTCRRYSSSGMRMSGFCMKMRSAVKWDFCCGYYDPNTKPEYKQEFKLASWNS